MATQLFFTNSISDYTTGHNDTKLDGAADEWRSRTLSTSRGAGAVGYTTTTVDGPTNGVEVQNSSASVVWYSPPLDADVTIAGSITWNLRASENNMSANVAINAQLQVVDGATGSITLIDKTARTTELGTSEAAANFAETPAAGVACKRGDRLRVVVFGDDAGTMGAGFSFVFNFAGTSGGASGDSYLTLTEDLSFAAEPSGTTIYPTGGSSDVASASLDLEAWTSRGSGAETAVTTLPGTTGVFDVPLHITKTAGGTVVDWWTRQLSAFTLGGAVRVNARLFPVSISQSIAVRCQIDRVDSDGSNATTWAVATCYPSNESSYAADTEVAVSFLLGGDDLSISAGQRLRIRFLLDDPGYVGRTGSNRDTSLYYAGTSGGASGDTYLTFSQTLTEFAAASTPRTTPYPQLLAH